MRNNTLFFSLLVAANCFAVTNVTHHTHFSKNMGNRQWGYNMYLPAGYDTGSQRYPVIYMLHGWGDDENRMVFMAETLHNAITMGKVPPTIMVFPNGGLQTFWCDYSVWQYQSNINPDSYVTKELVPHIDSTYRTLASRSTRLLQGFSMGGWGAQHFAYKYTSLFGRVCALSPGGRNVDSLNNPYRLIYTNADFLKVNTKIRLVVGAADGLKKESDSMVAIQTKLSIPHEYEVVPNVAHSPEGIYNVTGVRNLQFLTNNLSVTALHGHAGNDREKPGLRLDMNPAGSNFLTINYGLSKEALVTLKIFSASGKRIRALVNGRLERGRHSIAWDLKDSGGSPVPPGIYICTLRSDDFLGMSMLIPTSMNR